MENKEYKSYAVRPDSRPNWVKNKWGFWIWDENQ